MRPLALMLAVLLAALPALAVTPDERLDDPALESRARELSKDLRCVVCQNQSIDDSNAPLARDLRMLVRERLEAGDSDAQVLEFLTARYGDYVLLRPPFQTNTLLLWLAPGALVLVAGATLAAIAWRRRQAAEPAPLTEAEQQRLAALLDGPEGQP